MPKTAPVTSADYMAIERAVADRMTGLIRDKHDRYSGHALTRAINLSKAYLNSETGYGDDNAATVSAREDELRAASDNGDAMVTEVKTMVDGAIAAQQGAARKR
jgi:hypothetical protein